MRSLVLAAVLISSAALAEVDLPGYDAFLSSKDSRPLKLEALSDATRELVQRGRISTTERRLGVPTFFWAARDAKGLRSLKLSPEQAARRYLFAYAELYRTTGGALADARLSKLHDTGTGAIVAQFQKDVSGVKVFNDEIKVVMNQDLELIALTGYLTPVRRVLGDYQVGSEAAIDSAYQQLTGHALDATLRRLPTDAAGFERFTLGDEPTPVRARRVYFPLPSGLEPSWHIELNLSDREGTSSSYYAFVLSARDGRLMFRQNLTRHDFNYRVWADTTGLKAPFDGPQGNDATPHPTGTPNMFNAPFVAPNLVTLSNGPISTNDPWLAAGATTTDGNNVMAYADFNSPDGFSTGDLKATTTAADTFDRVYDTALSPNASPDQRMASVTQLFYDVNFFHDWYYDVGFDEKAGNAQKNNFARGGAANDALYAEGQDSSGNSNADMSTPSDGAHPRMQMYVFTPSGGGASTVIQGTTYRAGVADFGPTSFNLVGDMVLINDNDTANGSTATDGCTAAWTTPVTGKIAVIDRGLCNFSTKVENAQANGAIGALILNNSFGGAIPLSGTSAIVTIPSLSMGRSDGNALKTKLTAATSPISANLVRSAIINRDGTIDNAIVAHEWGHYISNRLIGDGNGISNNQGYGMGEGWGDFHSMMLVVKAGDDQIASNAMFNGTYGLAAYTTYLTDTNGYYWGIRRLPYSTNMSKNPLTFKHIQNGVALPTGISYAFGQNGSQNAEAHNTGEVWATMLWECYAALLRDNARLTFEQANLRMRQYLVAAYKTTPLLPTFVDARDAVLAAAVANDPTDFALFSAAFAKRGLGMLAIAPDKDAQDNKPVTESFITGNAFQIVKVELDDSVNGCDRDGHLDVGELGQLTVTIKNVGVGVLNVTGTARTATAGVMFPQGDTLTFPALDPFKTATASVQVSLQNNVPGNASVAFDVELNEPTLATPGPVRLTAPLRVNFDAKATGAFADDVEAPMTPWTFADNPNGATGSDFRRYEDTGTAHWFFGPNPDSPADTYLISPSLDVGQGPFTFSFSHRYQFEADAMEFFDGAVVEISVGGAAFSDIGAKLSQPYVGSISAQSNNPLRGRQVYSGESANYPAWSTVTADLGTQYAGKSVRIRFRIGSDDALGLKGWEIDNLSFIGLTNRPFPAVVTDPNVCTNRAPTVEAPTPRFVNEGQHVKLTALASDPDGEPVTVLFTQVAGPLVAMNGSEFDAPEVAEDTEMKFEVVASDGRAVSVPVTQSVVVKNLNKTPVTTIDPAEQAVDEGTEVTFTATATDGDGDLIQGYRWVQRSGPAVTLTGADTASLTVTAPEVPTEITLQFEVYARDGLSEGAPAIATLVVHNQYTEPPVVNPMPRGCGCGSADGTWWLATAMAMMLVLARKRQR